MKLAQRHLGATQNDALSELMNGPIRKKLGVIPSNVTWGGRLCACAAVKSIWQRCYPYTINKWCPIIPSNVTWGGGLGACVYMCACAAVKSIWQRYYPCTQVSVRFLNSFLDSVCTYILIQGSREMCSTINVLTSWRMLPLMVGVWHTCIHMYIICIVGTI